MIGFVAQRLMEINVGNRCGAAHGERSNGRTRAGGDQQPLRVSTFQMQYWSGSAWADVPGGARNNLVAEDQLRAAGHEQGGAT